MKRLLILSSLFLTTAFGVTAQDISRPQTTAPVSDEAIQQGNWMIGASLANIGLNFKTDLYQLDIGPRAGFFVSDNAVLGAEVQLGLDIYDGGENFRYAVTPFARYYFPEGAAPTHRWFGEIVAGLGGSSIKDSEDDASLSRVFGLRAGYAHFVASNVALEAIAGYTSTNADIDVGFGSSGLSIALGLQIFLPGRQ